MHKSFSPFIIPLLLLYRYWSVQVSVLALYLRPDQLNVQKIMQSGGTDEVGMYVKSLEFINKDETEILRKQ